MNRCDRDVPSFNETRSRMSVRFADLLSSQTAFSALFDAAYSSMTSKSCRVLARATYVEESSKEAFYTAVSLTGAPLLS